MSVRSMTGHGAGHATVGSKRIVVDVRTVNHRFFESRIKLPFEDPSLAHEVDALLRTELVRGRAELVARLEGAPNATAASIDKTRVRALWTEWTALRDELSPNAALAFDIVTHAPGVYGARDDDQDRAQLKPALLAATKAACDALNQMRDVEGAQLERDLSARLGNVRALRETIAATTKDAAHVAFNKLKERISAIVSAHALTLDEAKLVPELAQLSDRADVTEELTRLQSHCDQFQATLASRNAEGIGKRLDFLMQELGRETNTIGSKSQLFETTHLVVDLKTELERIREQVQNVL